MRKAFRRPGDLPKILIVTEKLLTGFDAPVLYCMYLDKPMRDHVLLQAIARVNRPYEDEYERAKPSGFVLDFVGVFENLEKALAFDSQDVKDVQQVVTDIELLKGDFTRRMERGRRDYLPLGEKKAPDKAAEAVLEHFREETPRQEFYQYFRELSEIYEIISPDGFLRPYLKDYDQLTRIYRLLRAAYDSIFVDHDLTRKTARLVQEHTHGGAIQDGLEIYEINERLLEKLAGDDTPETVKVFNLLKSIEQMVEQQGGLAPYLYTIGERALAIARAFQERQQATQQALQALEELIREINLAEKERAEMNLKPESFAVYWLLQREATPNAEWIARQMEDTFNRFPHWRSSPAQEREARIALYGVLLREAGGGSKGKTSEVKQLTALVDQIMQVAGRARGER